MIKNADEEDEDEDDSSQKSQLLLEANDYEMARDEKIKSMMPIMTTAVHNNSNLPSSF